MLYAVEHQLANLHTQEDSAAHNPESWSTFAPHAKGLARHLIMTDTLSPLARFQDRASALDASRSTS